MLLHVGLLISTERNRTLLLIIRTITINQFIAILAEYDIVLLPASFRFFTDSFEVIAAPCQDGATHHTHVLITPSILSYFR